MKKQVICNKVNTKHCLRVKEDINGGCTHSQPHICSMIAGGCDDGKTILNVKCIDVNKAKKEQ